MESRLAILIWGVCWASAYSVWTFFIIRVDLELCQHECATWCWRGNVWQRARESRWRTNHTHARWRHKVVRIGGGGLPLQVLVFSPCIIGWKRERKNELTRKIPGRQNTNENAQSLRLSRPSTFDWEKIPNASKMMMRGEGWWWCRSLGCCPISSPHFVDCRDPSRAKRNLFYIRHANSVCVIIDKGSSERSIVKKEKEKPFWWVFVWQFG